MIYTYTVGDKTLFFDISNRSKTIAKIGELRAQICQKQDAISKISVIMSMEGESSAEFYSECIQKLKQEISQLDAAIDDLETTLGQELGE